MTPNEAMQVLGLQPNYTPEELEQGYRKAAMRAHPDREGGSTQEFQRVSEAYAALTGERNGPSEDDMAAGMLREALNSSMQASHPLSSASSWLGARETELARAVVMANQEISRLGQLRKRITTKGARNELHLLIDATTRMIRSDIEQIGMKQRALAGAKRLLADYSDTANTEEQALQELGFAGIRFVQWQR